MVEAAAAAAISSLRWPSIASTTVSAPRPVHSVSSCPDCPVPCAAEARFYISRPYDPLAHRAADTLRVRARPARCTPRRPAPAKIDR
ncbi:hypothetical protein B0H17DRAFT_1201152 [Mycena rosella]|uniref:Uncharacterized protein n=1 Tax=Mycena rosella TaxID=1033263 RepID=A0AAD7DJV8_MYCRO|nr:hypothetical protein B0H17DRAFT_1201152 [Mycena rosella]